MTIGGTGMNCPNCNQPVGAGPYCGHCGQRLGGSHDPASDAPARAHQKVGERGIATRTWVAVGVVAALAVGGLAVAVALGVRSSSGEVNDASLPGVGKCYWPNSGDVIVKPTETAIGCNGTFLLEDLQWDSWDSQRAEGVGVINEVDLRPGDSNGSAPRKRTSVKIVADTPVTVACGLFFSRLEVTYLSGDRDGQVEVLDDMAPSDFNCE